MHASGVQSAVSVHASSQRAMHPLVILLCCVSVDAPVSPHVTFMSVVRVHVSVARTRVCCMCMVWFLRVYGGGILRESNIF